MTGLIGYLPAHAGFWKKSNLPVLLVSVAHKLIWEHLKAPDLERGISLESASKIAGRKNKNFITNK